MSNLGLQYLRLSLWKLLCIDETYETVKCEGKTICGIVGTALKQKMELFELPPYKKKLILELLGQILTSGLPL